MIAKQGNCKILQLQKKKLTVSILTWPKFLTFSRKILHPNETLYGRNFPGGILQGSGIEIENWFAKLRTPQRWQDELWVKHFQEVIDYLLAFSNFTWQTQIVIVLAFQEYMEWSGLIHNFFFFIYIFRELISMLVRDCPRQGFCRD